MFRRSTRLMTSSCLLASSHPLTSSRLMTSSHLLTSSRPLLKEFRMHLATLNIEPRISLIDDQLHISVSGLQPAQPITVHAYLKEGKIKYTSYAHYVTDEMGSCDVTKAGSIGGMYLGVESMGLFWSMEAGPGEPWGRRLIKFDVTTPYEPVISVYDGHLDWEECLVRYEWNDYLARTSCRRSYMAHDVTRHPVRHGRLRATFFKPSGPGPFPAVVDLFGLIGGLVEFRASLLASRGIASLAVAYFDHDDLPPTIDRLDLVYFYQSIDYLKTLSYVRQDQGFGVIGVSQGGQVAALMSAHFQEITCCLMINSGIHNLLLAPYWHGWIGSRLSTLDYLLEKGIKKADGTVDTVNVFDEFELTETSRIRIEKSRARHLLIASGSDGCVPASSVEVVAEYLERGGNRRYEILRLPGAGHLLEPPHSPMNPVIQCQNGKIASGGEKVGHARGQETAWTRILSFIHETLNSH